MFAQICRSFPVQRLVRTRPPQRMVSIALNQKIIGGCYCKNISLVMTLPPAEYQARACDCEFCRKHSAAYVSDPKGSLEIKVKETSALGRFRQESDDNAEFLHCKRCGVLIGAIHQCVGEGENNKIIGAVNRLAIDQAAELFPQVTTVQPRLLTREEKVRRWKEKWFQDVKISFQSGK
eukprot:gene9608-10432_t